jgi:8-oxo-dGTP pyrophosphatase MutT (NUDIX family)
VPRSDQRLLAADDPGLGASDRLLDARAAVAAADVDPAAEGHRRTILDFVDAHDDALHRSCRTGHLTGSALVVDATGGRVVVLHHRKLARWLQPGGHCDGDANLAAVALREAAEETGIVGLRVLPVAVDLDVHEVAPPDDGPHLHLDVRYLVQAPPGAEPRGNHESNDVRWATLTELADLDLDEGTWRMVRHGLARHQELARP